MQLFLKRLKGDPVLLAAWGLALVSAFLVPPDREWLGYVDFHTLGLLFCLMLVMAGLQDIGFFQRLGEGILGRTRTARQLELVLVLLCFFTAMLITNDVALITFVPFAGAVLGMAGLTDCIVPVVVFQTVAANLGSMATPRTSISTPITGCRWASSSGQYCPLRGFRWCCSPERC